jgi:hypothetical protein
MSILCRTCAHPVEIDRESNTFYCADCNKELTKSDVIASWAFNARMRQLKAMHELMRNADDETIYMSWIGLVPDEPSEEDFEYIAADDDMYNECFDLFIELIQNKDNRW